MPATEMITITAAFAALLLGFIHLMRMIQSWITHTTIRRAIEKDPATAEGMIERVTAPPPVRDNGDDRIAVILVALGLATIGASIVAGDPGWARYGVGGALFPLLIGAALWLRHSAIQRAARRAEPK